MERILISLFGGGICDWEDISQTEYDWEDIFEYAKNYVGADLDINCFYGAILHLALSDLQNAMQNYKGGKSKEFKNCTDNIYNYFDIYSNCLDTHISFIGDEKLGNEIIEKLSSEIDTINKNIGFTYIENLD